MSSVFSNAPGVRALTGLQASRSTPSQKSTVIRQVVCPQCLGIRPRLYAAYLSGRAADSNVSPRHNPRLLNSRIDLNERWEALRRRALDSLASDKAGYGRKDIESAASETPHENGTNRQNTHNGRRNGKRPQKVRCITKILQAPNVHDTLFQSFHHLNYKQPPRKFRDIEPPFLAKLLQRHLEIMVPPTPGDNAFDQATEVNKLIYLFDSDTLTLLSKKGYCPEDIMAWAWILTAQESLRAALRLSNWNRRQSFQRRTPLFVVKLLLHRSSLNIQAFRILLDSLLPYLTQLPHETSASTTSLDMVKPTDTSVTKSSAMLINARAAESLVMLLLRRARQIWPEAQLYIAQAYAYYLNNVLPQSQKFQAHNEKLNILRVKHFNACLKALSIPSQHSPFKSASFQQRAQFELLKAMTSHEAPLPVSRRGYQALVAVQLAHKKTPAERVFAEQKAHSWPPWKEARMGIDAERGNEGMNSRTMQVLSQMREAGYSQTHWEEVAGILGGWDTDGTPTIQTRSLPMPFSKALLENSKENTAKVETAIWAARIRATRTLREAWACFLQFKARYPIRSERIYHAMAKKIIYSQALKERPDTIPAKNMALPGDGLEVSPEPSSARDVIYVPIEPPTLEEFLKEMTVQGVRPGDSFIALLLRTSPNFLTGLKFVCAFLRPEQVRALCCPWAENYEQEALYTLSVMKPFLFDSFVAFLSSHTQIKSSRHRVRKADHFPILMRPPDSAPRTSILLDNEDMFCDGHGYRHPLSLSHAANLLKTLKPRRASAWLPLIRALALQRGLASERFIKADVQSFVAWYEVTEVLRWMQELEVDPGMDGLLVLCQIFSRAVADGVKDTTLAEEGLHLVENAKSSNGELQLDNAIDFEEFVYKGLHLLKSYFDRLVYPTPSLSTETHQLTSSFDGGISSGSNLPDLLQVPNPAILHALVRALGSAEDYGGILNLLQWMSHYASDLNETAGQSGNGQTMMRRTLTAIRIFLEESTGVDRVKGHVLKSTSSYPQSFSEYGQDADSNRDDRPVFSDSLVEEAYRIIENTEGWGSWPSDDDVRTYLTWDSRQV